MGEAQAPLSAADLPDDAQICNCNGVSKGAIVGALRGGCRTLKAVCDATRAGTGCGSCKVQVKAIVEAVAGDDLQDDPSAHYYVPGVAMAKRELVAAIKEMNLRSVSQVFDVLAAGKEDPGSKAGLASLLKTIWGNDVVEERDARFINDRVHANIQKDRTYSVVPRIFGGVTSAADLRKIADVADKYNVRMVKITGGQRIDLLGLTREQLPDVWKDLGMPSGHAYTKAFRTCKTCVGSEFCRFGVGDSTALGIAIEKRFQGLESPAKMKLATAGCPRNCSEATVKDLGAVAIEGGRWEIYIGGAAGAHVRKGDLLATVDSQEEVITLMGRFMQWYREEAKYLERTYDFVPRMGLDRVRAVIVDDAEGIAARLDADMQKTVDGFVDPWLEAHQPVHPSQFTPGAAGGGREGRGDPMSAVVGTHAARQVNLGPFDRIPIGEGRTFDVDGLEIAVFRPRSGEVFATQASCPHANGPLADGLVGNGKVVCPFHAYRFDLATGCPEGNTCAPLTTYPAGLTTDGDVVVTLGGR